MAVIQEAAMNADNMGGDEDMADNHATEDNTKAGNKASPQDSGSDNQYVSAPPSRRLCCFAEDAEDASAVGNLTWLGVVVFCATLGACPTNVHGHVFCRR